MLLKLNLFYNNTDDCHDFKVCILEDLIMFASGHREPNQHISLHPVYRVARAINFTVLDLVWGRMGLLQLFFGFFYEKKLWCWYQVLFFMVKYVTETNLSNKLVIYRGSDVTIHICYVRIHMIWAQNVSF